MEDRMSLTLLRRWRGLRWKGTRPTARELGIDAHGVLFALAILLAFGLVDMIDRWQDARIAEAAALDRVAEQQAAMLACLNGGSPGYYTLTKDGHRVYLVCEIREVSNENVTRKRS
jgi:hypothetical protein